MGYLHYNECPWPGGEIRNDGKCDAGHVFTKLKPRSIKPLEERRWGLWEVIVGDGTSISGGVLGRCYVMAETTKDAIKIGKKHISTGWSKYSAHRIKIVT